MDVGPNFRCGDPLDRANLRRLEVAVNSSHGARGVRVVLDLRGRPVDHDVAPVELDGVMPIPVPHPFQKLAPPPLLDGLPLEDRLLFILVVDLLRAPLPGWRRWADDVTGHGLDAGHFLPEERPDEVAAALRELVHGD